MVLLGERFWQYGDGLWQPHLWEHACKLTIFILIHLVLNLLQHGFLAFFCIRVNTESLHILFQRIFVGHDQYYRVRILVIVENHLLDILTAVCQTILKTLWTVFFSICTD